MLQALAQLGALEPLILLLNPKVEGDLQRDDKGLDLGSEEKRVKGVQRGWINQPERGWINQPERGQIVSVLPVCCSEDFLC